MLDTNLILSELAQIDAAIATTTNNMSTAFATSANNALLSFNMFKDSVLVGSTEIDTAILNTQTVGDAAYFLLFNNAILYFSSFKENFIASTAEIDTAILNTQIAGDAAYALLFSNALLNFTTFKDAFLTGLDEVNIKCSEVAVGAESALCLAFLNSQIGILESLGILKSEAEIKFGEIKSAGETSASNIKIKFVELFNEINSNFKQIPENVTKALEELNEIYGAKTTEINEKTTSIGSTSEASGEQASSTFETVCNVFGLVGDSVGTVADLIGSASTIMGLFSKSGEKQVEVEDSIINMLIMNTGAQLTNTGATAAAGTTATASTPGILAFGAGMLLTGMAVALVAKTVFNFLKMSGMNTNGVKSSDFDLGFNIPGLADGGFPSMGQMFIAREAGPELVGTIGSRSAVVNNDQIVESVSAGVYRAVKAAMGQNGGGVIQLILDGTKVAEVVSDNVNAITRRTGRCPILV